MISADCLFAAISPTMKNTAWMWCFASASSTAGVVLGFGPSSNVKISSGSPDAVGPAAGNGHARGCFGLSLPLPEPAPADAPWCTFACALVAAMATTRSTSHAGLTFTI